MILQLVNGQLSEGGSSPPHPSSTYFPKVQIVCLPVEISFDQKTSGEAIDLTRKSLITSLADAHQTEAGLIFVTGRLVENASSTDAKVCAIVDHTIATPSLKVETLPARKGFAGFCKEVVISTCLAKVFVDLGLSPNDPSIAFPIYYYWKKTPPANANEAVIALANLRVPINTSMPGIGDPVVRSRGLHKASVCDLDQCLGSPSIPEYTVASSDALGVVWFIPKDN